MSWLHGSGVSPLSPDVQTVCLVSTLEKKMGGVGILKGRFQIHLWRHFNPFLFGSRSDFFLSECMPADLLMLQSGPPLCPPTLPSEQHVAR